jgi:hypothetical protein
MTDDPGRSYTSMPQRLALRSSTDLDEFSGGLVGVGEWTVRCELHGLDGLPLIETLNRRAVLSIDSGLRLVRRTISSSVMVFARAISSRSSAIELCLRPISLRAIKIAYLQLQSDGWLAKA